MTAIHESETGASAPALSEQVPAEAIAGKDDLFPKRTPKRATVHLPDVDRTISLEALTPRDYEEVNHAAVIYDKGMPKLDNRMWNARLVARSIRDANGQRMYKDEQGWRALAIRMASEWTIADLQLAAETSADVSGISKKAREDMEQVLGEDSSGTEIAT